MPWSSTKPSQERAKLVLVLVLGGPAGRRRRRRARVEAVYDAVLDPGVDAP